MAVDYQKQVRDALTKAARQATMARSILEAKAVELDLSHDVAAEIMEAVRDAKVLLVNALGAFNDG